MFLGHDCFFNIFMQQCILHICYQDVPAHSIQNHHNCCIGNASVDQQGHTSKIYENQYDPGQPCNHHNDSTDSIFDGSSHKDHDNTYQPLHCVNFCVLHIVQSCYREKYLCQKSIMKSKTHQNKLYRQTNRISHGICIILRSTVIELHFEVFRKEESQPAATISQTAAVTGR